MNPILSMVAQIAGFGEGAQAETNITNHIINEMSADELRDLVYDLLARLTPAEKTDRPVVITLPMVTSVLPVVYEFLTDRPTPKVIQAIKAVREATGASLIDAKNFVDQLRGLLDPIPF